MRMDANLRQEEHRALLKLHLGSAFLDDSSDSDESVHTMSSNDSFERYRPRPYNYEEVQSVLVVVDADPISDANLDTDASNEETKGEKLASATDKALEKKLMNLTQPKYCFLCKANLQMDAIAKQHYESNRHSQNVKNWYENEGKNIRKSGNAILGENSTVYHNYQKDGKKYGSLQTLNVENETPATDEALETKLKNLMQPSYCFLCKTNLKYIAVAKQHYESNRHSQNVKNWYENEGKNIKKDGKKYGSSQTLNADNEIPVIDKDPEHKLKKLIQPQYCGLCKIRFYKPMIANQHYESQRHLEKLHYWHINERKRVDRQDNNTNATTLYEKSIVTNQYQKNVEKYGSAQMLNDMEKLARDKALEKLNDLMNPKYCFLCSANLPMDAIAKQHYESKHHLENLAHWFKNEREKFEKQYNDKNTEIPKENRTVTYQDETDLGKVDILNKVEIELLNFEIVPCFSRSDLQEEFLNQLTIYYCKVCDTLLDVRSYKVHYMSKMHKNESQNWYYRKLMSENQEEKPRTNKEQKKEPTKVNCETETAANKGQENNSKNVNLFQSTSAVYCYLCKQYFYTSRDVTDHVWGFVHQGLLQLVLTLIEKEIPLQEYWIKCFKKRVTANRCDFCGTTGGYSHFKTELHQKQMQCWVDNFKIYSGVLASDDVDRNACFCKICKKDLDGTTRTEGHYAGKLHKRNLKFYCEICNLQCWNISKFEEHHKSSSVHVYKLSSTFKTYEQETNQEPTKINVNDRNSGNSAKTSDKNETKSEKITNINQIKNMPNKNNKSYIKSDNFMSDKIRNTKENKKTASEDNKACIQSNRNINSDKITNTNENKTTDKKARVKSDNEIKCDTTNNTKPASVNLNKTDNGNKLLSTRDIKLTNLNEEISRELENLIENIYSSNKIPPKTVLQYLQKFNNELNKVKRKFMDDDLTHDPKDTVFNSFHAEIISTVINKQLTNDEIENIGKNMSTKNPTDSFGPSATDQLHNNEQKMTREISSFSLDDSTNDKNQAIKQNKPRRNGIDSSSQSTNDKRENFLKSMLRKNPDSLVQSATDEIENIEQVISRQIANFSLGGLTNDKVQNIKQNTLRKNAGGSSSESADDKIENSGKIMFRKNTPDNLGQSATDEIENIEQITSRDIANFSLGDLTNDKVQNIKQNTLIKNADSSSQSATDQIKNIEQKMTIEIDGDSSSKSANDKIESIEQKMLTEIASFSLRSTTNDKVQNINQNRSRKNAGESLSKSANMSRKSADHTFSQLSIDKMENIKYDDISSQPASNQVEIIEKNLPGNYVHHKSSQLTHANIENVILGKISDDSIEQKIDFEKRKNSGLIENEKEAPIRNSVCIGKSDISNKNLTLGSKNSLTDTSSLKKFSALKNPSVEFDKVKSNAFQSESQKTLGNPISDFRSNIEAVDCFEYFNKPLQNYAASNENNKSLDKDSCKNNTSKNIDNELLKDQINGLQKLDELSKDKGKTKEGNVFSRLFFWGKKK